MKYVTRADLVLICSILGASVLLAAFFVLPARHRDADVAVIEQDGHELMRLFTGQEQTVRIPSANGFNVIAVTKSGVFVSEADCPDQICVRQGEISQSGESIVCLPHRLVIRLEGEGTGELDAMTN